MKTKEGEECPLCGSVAKTCQLPATDGLSMLGDMWFCVCECVSEDTLVFVDTSRMWRGRIIDWGEATPQEGEE